MKNGYPDEFYKPGKKMLRRSSYDWQRVSLFVLAILTIGNAANAVDKPNIVLVITDDQGYPPVGANDHPWIRTPNLDALAEQSLVFDQFFVSPTCAPTRSAIMSGRHPFKNGVTHTVLERERMSLETTTLPQVLKTVGYSNGIFGKWHLGDQAEYQPEARGFDEVFVHGAGGIGQKYQFSCADVPGNKYFDPAVRYNGRFVKTRGYCTDVFFTAAVDWIRKQKDKKQPFFAYISTNAPHAPFIAPQKNAQYFLDKGFPKGPANFYGMIENIDENMGYLQAKLKEWDMFDNTILIFMSDNGMAGVGMNLGGEKLADGYGPFNSNMKGLKNSIHEGGVRVPFIMRWDGKVKAGSRTDALAAHIDLMPTFAAITEAKLPEGQVDGENLLPVIRGENKSTSERFLFNHIGRWPKDKNPDDFKWVNFSIRNQQFRYVSNVTTDDVAKGEFEKGSLYDIHDDPGQKKDIRQEHPELIKAMRAAYEEFWDEARPLMVNEDIENSTFKPYHKWYNEQKEKDGIPEWTVER